MKPRGLLIANPNATSTSPYVRDVITGGLATAIDLDVVTTTHRGHAHELAAASAGTDILITLGGDGTINEAVNGLLNSKRSNLPQLATIPGGSANVLARALGFPNDAIEATGMVLESVRAQSNHPIGLGNATFTAEGDKQPRSQWFTINAGVGIDADVVASMEGQRAEGHTASGSRYARTAAREWVRGVGRRTRPLSLFLPDREPVERLAMVIVQNTSPWTYLGTFPINPCPRASFDTGLDAFAPHSLGAASATRYGLRMLRGSTAGDVRGRLTTLHDEAAFLVTCQEPANLQVDGDSMGRVGEVYFTYAPAALRIVG